MTITKQFQFFQTLYFLSLPINTPLPALMSQLSFWCSVELQITIYDGYYSESGGK